ncbi:RRM (RNA recognition motif) superfamily domain-containing protein [Histoplasma capsulatum G186AR]|uniref:RRM (RNA recognition motif) superfamily domain-containing protein n=1 Tax=Ajellomyces capsulatus TaxID=5037 RepID=A0A8H7YPF4_AJECA|nr:RRM (RNA recognition motif) superfamily domain-containing protein [Histoplasma capsulatum]QSS74699.1 RRM (RNA recognition motif) superfamily domain-containing protein [Histoplasma capsulatum G186AR]
MGHTKNPSAVNPNAVGANRHFVGVTETMGQKGGDVLSSVTLATSMEHDPSFLTAQTFQLPSDHNYATQHQNPAPAASPMTATTAMAVTMSAAHNGPYGYAGNPVCYPYAMPFDNGARYSLPPRFGVIKITNIPYAVTKHEILQFLGRNARPLTPDLGCAVHIIMERSTGKTMDCYIEFPTKADAECTLAWVNRGLDTCQTPKLGNRHVVVRASNQDELLKDLFPRAKNIDWRNGIPHVRAGIEKYCSGFQGFLTGEEIFCTVRHAEMPQRSVYCAKCLQRPYENMMSTLYKFPWYATYFYTVEDRNQIFSATLRLIHALVPQVERGQTIGLDSRLVWELLEAGLRCPVFNDRQKFVLNIAAKNYRVAASPTARFWPFDTLTRKPNATEEHVMQYAELIVAGSATKNPGTYVLANTWHPVMHAGSPFGKVWLEWGWGNTHHKWQTAVDYEISVLTQLVTEGVKSKRGTESPSHSLPSSASSPSVSVDGPSSVSGPISENISQSVSPAVLRYPVRHTHSLSRQARSAPINFIHDACSTNVPDCKDDASRSNQANRRKPSNSFSGFADTRVIPHNMFGAVGTRRRTRAATNGSRHSPVPEVDEGCYERSV